MWFLILQKWLPKHVLTRFLGVIAKYRGTFFKNWIIRLFVNYYGVNLQESLITDINQFKSFNDFFIRQLRSDSRPQVKDPDAILSPADGVISEFGKIAAGRLLQAKGVYYDVLSLLGGDQKSESFIDGDFITIYLAPKDYHRVHMPVKGQLKKMTYIPGQLFSVNPQAVNGIPQLFSRNERVVCHFDTKLGPMVLIFVGAMLVGSVVTSWQGQVMPMCPRSPYSLNYQNPTVLLQRGEEAGYFQWGSTVIILFSPTANIQWVDLSPKSLFK